MSEAMTERQKKSLDEMTAEARTLHGAECPDWRPSSQWVTAYAEEIRPGRGHDIQTTYIDSDNVVYIHLDPYGMGALAVGSVDWTHSGDDDQCDCEPCTRYAEDNG